MRVLALLGRSSIEGCDHLQALLLLCSAVKTIGRGAKSFVQVARNRATNSLVAIKFIPRGAALQCQMQFNDRFTAPP